MSDAFRDWYDAIDDPDELCYESDAFDGPCILAERAYAEGVAAERERTVAWLLSGDMTKQFDECAGPYPGRVSIATSIEQGEHMGGAR